MRNLLTALGIALTLVASIPAFAKPNDREWSAIATDYQWLESLRKAQPAAPAGASRKQQIDTMLSNLQKIEPAYLAFAQKLNEYYTRTGDPRAAQILAREKMILGDQYMALSRYDRALELYRAALVFQPDSPDATARIAAAESKRFVSMDAFASIRNAMKEEDVRGLIGHPREDWVRQLIQNGRAYTVWIYPKSDGGAAAVYFDNGVVYHTNWNAAAPQAPAASDAK